MAIVKKTKITIDVNLDENNIPEQMQWTAPDGGVKDMETKAILLSFWDAERARNLKNGFMDKRHAYGSNAPFLSSDINVTK